MNSLVDAREKAKSLMAESLLRELTDTEEALVVGLLKENNELQETFAAFQALASSRALMQHELSTVKAGAKFLTKAKFIRSQTGEQPSFLKTLWRTPKSLGGAFVLTQIVLLVIFVQVLKPLNDFDQQVREPLYRGGQQILCGDYETTFKADANFPELFLLMAQSGISIVKGPNLRGRFELLAPGLSETELGELLGTYMNSLKKAECMEKTQ